MAWTYDPDDMNTTTAEGRKNSVRFLIGDTDSGDPLVQDEEIVFALAQSSDFLYEAAAYCAFAIYSKFARMVNTELDEAIRADYSDLAKNYKSMYSVLEGKAKIKQANLRMIVTGTSLQCGEITRDRFKNSLAGNDVPCC